MVCEVLEARPHSLAASKAWWAMGGDQRTLGIVRILRIGRCLVQQPKTHEASDVPRRSGAPSHPLDSLHPLNAGTLPEGRPQPTA